MRKILFAFFPFLFLLSCSSSTNSNKDNHYDLPTQFPLTVGNAWVYERHDYETGADSMILDTLYISGMYNDYYKYSWSPDEYYLLVKNFDNKLLIFGNISFGDYPDTAFFDKPCIGEFFGEDTGYVNIKNFDNYYLMWYCLHIAIIHDFKLFDNIYDAYVTSKIDTIADAVISEQFTTIEGLVQWNYYDTGTGELTGMTKMIAKYTNFYPPNNLTKSSTKSNIKSTISGNNFIHRFLDEY